MLQSKLNKKLSFWAGFQWNRIKVSQQGLFFLAGQNEYNKSFAMIKTEQKLQWVFNIMPLWQLCYKPRGFLVVYRNL